MQSRLSSIDRCMAACAAVGMTLIGAGLCHAMTMDEADYLLSQCQTYALEHERETYTGNSLLKINVTFDESRLDEPVQPKTGTAFLVDRRSGLLVTALHTLLPENQGNCTQKNLNLQHLAEVSTQIQRSNNFEKVSLQVIDGGWDPCLDVALLKIDPAVVTAALPFDLSTVNPGNDDQLGVYNVIGFGAPQSNYPIGGVSHTFGSAQTMACPTWVPSCCGAGNSCISAQGVNANPGHSGGPIADRLGRVFGVIVRRDVGQANDQMWAVPASRIANLVEKHATIDESRAKEIIDLALNHPEQMRDIDVVGNVELRAAVRQAVRQPSDYGLTPRTMICPLSNLVADRRLGQTLSSDVWVKAMTVASGTGDPSKTDGTHAREVGQAAVRTARLLEASGDLDRATDYSLRAEAAFRAAIADRIDRGDGPGYLNTLRLSPEDGGPPSPILVSTELAGALGVEGWTRAAAPVQDAGLASMLREYADASLLAARLGGQDEHVALALATGAAVWSIGLDPTTSGSANSYRTYGDALVAARRFGNASTAYATAVTVAATTDTALADRILPRFVEAAELAGEPVGERPINSRALSAALAAARQMPIQPQRSAVIEALTAVGPRTNIVSN